MSFKSLESFSQSAFVRLLGPFRRQLALLVFISAVTNLLMLTPTLYMLQIFDRIMVSQSLVSLAILSFITAGLYAVQAFSEWLRTKVIVATGIRIDEAINRPLFYSMMTPSFGVREENPAQSMSDLMTIRQWLTGSGLYAFLDAPWAPFYIFIMFVMHPILGWFSLASVLALGVFAAFAVLRSRKLAEVTSDEDRELNKFLFNKLKNAEVIEAHGMVPNFYRQWLGQQVDFLRLQVHATDHEERLTAASKQLKVLLGSLSIAVGAVLAIEGEITMGAMIAAGLLASRATAPVDSFVFGWKGLLSVRHAYSRIKVQIEKSRNIASAWDGSKNQHSWIQLAPGSLSLNVASVSLDHPNKASKILKDVSFEVKEGECMVITGPSGAGKSSLAKILVGLLAPDTGTATLGASKVHELSQLTRRANIGFLSQESELFEESVAKNIAGMSDVQPGQVIASASLVGLHDTILKLENGYDTLVSEQDGILSAGQRQRLALARAFYDSPRLIVLDEPNSNLDGLGELALNKAVRAAKARGAIVVIVAHRDSVFGVADKLLVIAAGSIQYVGPPGEYSSISSSQTT